MKPSPQIFPKMSLRTKRKGYFHEQAQTGLSNREVVEPLYDTLDIYVNRSK